MPASPRLDARSDSTAARLRVLSVAASWVAFIAPAAVGTAQAPQPPLAAARAEVEAALRMEARATAFADRAAAVRRLVAVHESLATDHRFAASAAATGLRKRVATRLTIVREWLRPLAGEPAASLAGASVSPVSEADAGLSASSAPPRAGVDGGRQAEARLLIDLIEATIHPEVWDVQGGPCRIRYFPNGQGLVVRATQEVHEDLGRLLRQLRAAGYD